MVAKNNEAWHTEVASSNTTPNVSMCFVPSSVDLTEGTSKLEEGTIEDVGTILSKVNDWSKWTWRLPTSHYRLRLRLALCGSSLGIVI